MRDKTNGVAMEIDKAILTPMDLMREFPPVKLTHGDYWGNWVYNERNLTLAIRNRGLYEIDLERCTTCQDVLNWLFHMQEKNWMSSEDLANLARAFRDVIGWDIVHEKKISNIKKHLKEKTYIKGEWSLN